MAHDEEKAAILRVLVAETEAWLRRDLDSLASYWVQSPQARRMSSIANHGIQVQEGWDAIFEAFKSMAKQFPKTFSENRVSRERMNFVINGDMAFVSFDQIGEKSDDEFEMVGTQHELRIFQKIAGQWKIFCNVVLQRAVDHETCPLIEVDSARRVLWMNAVAHEQLGAHPFLVIGNGVLRSRDRARDTELQDAVTWARSNLHWHAPQSFADKPARPVVLGDDGGGSLVYCWVLLEDGKTFVSFNDNKMVKRRVAIAQVIYDLSTAQVRVAELLAEGHDLTAVAETLGVSVNTIRTHLQRMFDRTGARSQATLISMLLTAEAPTA